MRPLALLCLLLLLGCGPNFISKHGVQFYFYNGARWDKAVVDETEEWFLLQLDKHNEKYPRSKTTPVMRRLYVYLYLGSGDSGVQGFSDANVISLKDTMCVYQSGYTHELAHRFQEFIYGTRDYTHKESALWNIANTGPRLCE